MTFTGATSTKTRRETEKNRSASRKTLALFISNRMTFTGVTSTKTRRETEKNRSASRKTLALFISSFTPAESNKNMEKTKRMTLGVQKKTKPTKQNKKKFLNDVLHYLKSDCHMFAPLISSPLSVKMKEPIEGNKRRVLMKVGKYMKSDTYMYAPLVSSQLMSSPPSGKIQWIRKFKEVPTRMFNLKENHQSTESANLIAEKQPHEDSCSRMSTADNQSVGHGETVKHMVFDHCRSLSVSGKAIADLQLRELGELVVE